MRSYFLLLGFLSSVWFAPVAAATAISTETVGVAIVPFGAAIQPPFKFPEATVSAISDAQGLVVNSLTQTSEYVVTTTGPSPDLEFRVTYFPLSTSVDDPLTEGARVSYSVTSNLGGLVSGSLGCGLLEGTDLPPCSFITDFNGGVFSLDPELGATTDFDLTITVKAEALSAADEPDALSLLAVALFMLLGVGRLTVESGHTIYRRRRPLPTCKLPMRFLPPLAGTTMSTRRAQREQTGRACHYGTGILAP
jgi:hypothetical protein